MEEKETTSTIPDDGSSKDGISKLIVALLVFAVLASSAISIRTLYKKSLKNQDKNTTELELNDSSKTVD